MTDRFPVKLNIEPLVEAIFELRFQPAKLDVATLLPGLLFNEFSPQYTIVSRLPIMELPETILTTDPYFYYTPQIKLESDIFNQSILIGNRVISLSNYKPYSGWEKFSADIFNLIDKLKNTNLIDYIERFSLKYVNALHNDPFNSLKYLNINCNLMDYDLTNEAIKGTSFRTEIIINDILCIIQITYPAIINIIKNNEQINGILFDIDCILNVPKDTTWIFVKDSINKLHATIKNLFYNLLTKDALNLLGPKY
jgi:uncharacterized protein (TIGR04255 family)